MSFDSLKEILERPLLDDLRHVDELLADGRVDVARNYIAIVIGHRESAAD